MGRIKELAQEEQHPAAARDELDRNGPQIIKELEQYEQYVADGKPGNNYKAWLILHGPAPLSVDPRAWEVWVSGICVGVVKNKTEVIGPNANEAIFIPLYAKASSNSESDGVVINSMDCPVCRGTGELKEAVQAWDEPDAPVPECQHCEDGIIDVLNILDEIRVLREALEIQRLVFVNIYEYVGEKLWKSRQRSDSAGHHCDYRGALQTIKSIAKKHVTCTALDKKKLKKENE